MHHELALIAERKGGTCINRHLSRLLSVYVPYVQGLMQNYYRARGVVSLEAASLFPRGRGKVVYIYPTLALLLMGFNEYDHDDDLPKMSLLFKNTLICHQTTYSSNDIHVKIHNVKSTSSYYY
ncbi:hypothetical protein Hanom_Chr11g00969351 [Helianthus anomalus]